MIRDKCMSRIVTNVTYITLYFISIVKIIPRQRVKMLMSHEGQDEEDNRHAKLHLVCDDIKRQGPCLSLRGYKNLCSLFGSVWDTPSAFSLLLEHKNKIFVPVPKCS